MEPILFCTGNNVKLRTAETICAKYGIKVTQIRLDIPEIQAPDGQTVARDKALRAFEALQKPVVIADDSWLIPGLKGFPGPYMKDVNGWLSEEDWLNLTKPLTDRSIILRQVIVYQDVHQQQLFHTDVEGTLLTDIRGKSKYPHTSITSFDNGTSSVAEEIMQNRSAIAAAVARTSWDDFCEWYLAQHPAK
jgi:XTP/dITP diphosphohydrolase